MTKYPQYEIKYENIIISHQVKMNEDEEEEVGMNGAPCWSVGRMR